MNLLLCGLGVLFFAGSVPQVDRDDLPVVHGLQAPKQVTIQVLSRLGPTWIEVSGLPGRLLQVQVSMEDGQTSRVLFDRVRLRCAGRAPIEIVAKNGSVMLAAKVGVQDLDLGGLLTVRAQNKLARVYSGQLEISEHEGKCFVSNTTSLEDYVSAVACREIRGAGIQAHLAQAVLVRTWYLTNRHKHASSGVEVCDLTHCQVYTGHNACSQRMRSKLAEVAGLVLIHKGKPADVAYFSTCGGHTAQADEIWGLGSKRVYLAGVKDANGHADLCIQSPHWRWRFEIQRSDFCSRIRKVVPVMGSGACQLVIHAGQGGWNREVIISAQGSKRMRGEAFHMLMGRLVGWGQFKSANFQLRSNKDRFVFMGKGMGHGVGMCQYGAMGLEKRGATYPQILSHYFPHTELGRLP